MKFRSKKIRGNNNYRLMRYDESLEQDLGFLSFLNNDFYKLVKNVSYTTNDDLAYQGYILYKGDSATGLVYIVEGKRYLEIDFDYDETVLDIEDVINQLIDTCMYLCHDKEEVLVLPHRPMELSGKRFDVNEHMVVYQYQNPYSNRMHKMTDEIAGLYEFLITNHLSWEEDFNFDDSLSDEETANDYYGHKVPYSHIFDFVKTLKWNGIETQASTGKVAFNSDGTIKVEKRVKPTNPYHSYNVTYSVDNHQFILRSLRNVDKCSHYIEIENDSNTVVSKLDKTTIEYDYRNHLKTYSSSKTFHHMKMNIVYEEDGQGTFRKGILEFITLNDQLIDQGRFVIEIKDSQYTLYGYTKDGKKSVLKVVPLEGIIDYHTIDMVASRLNGIITGNNDLLTMEDLFNDEETIVSYVKQVMDDTHLPHLKHVLDNYLYSSKANISSKQKKLND